MNTTKYNNLFGKIASVMLIIFLIIEVIYVLLSSIQYNFFALAVITAPLFLLQILWIYCVANNKKDKKLIYVFAIYIALELLILLITTFNVTLGGSNYSNSNFSDILTIFQMIGYIIIEAIMLYTVKATLNPNKDNLKIDYKPLITLITIIYFGTTILSFFIAILDFNLLDFFYTMLYPPFELLSYIFTMLWLLSSTTNSTNKELLQLEPETQPIQNISANNNNTTNTNSNTTTQKETLTVHEKIEILKGYKELLDNGIITQEEFDAKKKEIL